MAAHGHLVANHTLYPPQRVPPSQSCWSARLTATRRSSRPPLASAPCCSERPYGARAASLDQALRERDLVQVGWNLDPQEWKGGGDEASTAYVTKRLARFAGRAILLLHDTHPPAVRALPRILDWIARENAPGRRATAACPSGCRRLRGLRPQPPASAETGFEPLLADLRYAVSALPGLAGR